MIVSVYCEIVLSKSSNAKEGATVVTLIHFPGAPSANEQMSYDNEQF